MNIEEIANEINRRRALLGGDDSDQEVDKIKDKIIAVIKASFRSYPVDFIIETYTHFGYAPTLVYDDNGMFAVTGNGYQPVVTGDERLEGAITVFIEKNEWFPTIREALWDYMNR